MLLFTIGVIEMEQHSFGDPSESPPSARHDVCFGSASDDVDLTLLAVCLRNVAWSKRIRIRRLHDQPWVANRGDPRRLHEVTRKVQGQM